MIKYPKTKHAQQKNILRKIEKHTKYLVWKYKKA